ncbi:MAG: pirin family protein [Burkholderiaceae bacterium]|nr:MAG: pirin family protein [Burkholderiaceae bacterium]
MTPRTVDHVIRALATSDGAGVKLLRSLGSRQDARLDPFLMLDEFGTENPDDYIAGFPSHPHRGFETVTYMLDGHMEHRDHLGHVGNLGPGGVQWMTAGRGVIHSEMPKQDKGRMRGFQLWINLPAAEKMKPAHYRDIPAAEIPVVALAQGGSVKVIAGTAQIDGKATAGAINSGASRLSTDPLYLDVQLAAGKRFEQPITAGYNALAYVYEGSATTGDAATALPTSSAALFGTEGERVSFTAGKDGARLLLLAGKPIREPMVQYGPFVMNTRAEIEQAMLDYQAGKLVAA